MSGPLSLPDDTIEFDVDQPSDRPLGLMIGIGVLTLLVLVGLGYLIFGNLTGGDGGTTAGLGGPGAPPAIGGPSDSPSPSATDTTTPVPVSATTPATTHTPTPSTSSTTLNVSVGVVNGSMKPQSYAGPACPATTMAQATVVAGGPVGITYHWNYVIDGKPGATPPATYQFKAAGSQQFSYQFGDLAIVSGRVTATFVMTAPVTRRAAMQYTQECGASASNIVMTPAQPTCGTPVTFSSTMSAGVGPMTIAYRWHTTIGINPPNIPTWSVHVGGDQKVTNQNYVAAKGMTVTLTLNRLSPPTPASGALTFKTSITIDCAH